jgi:hypothetical protein
MADSSEALIDVSVDLTKTETGPPIGTAQPERIADLARRMVRLSGLTVRDDTFTIRAYGEARDVNDRITARAWCEAVVIRRKPFIDRRDDVATVPDNLSSINQRFGRRLEMASFRWLQANEI